ncbi:GTP pyrophosphokinase [Insolitispirillum peregrinum]|uniref:GTP pyrophosphokinase rsh n=2 Tax=Insolitispirillum peregrinum TaxID=80876 RepID=A0A1N7IVF2_9PROT|nr:GTP pyrophosphokinase [Insolitispirillum peregrinum]
MRQFELVERVRSYDPGADEDALNRAYVYAVQKHGSQTRASGDPYFSHPVEVAGILTRYKLDTATIITALLHDTIEDTDATAEEIQRLFGDDVARLVDGVTKLTRIQLQSDQTKQAENFRKLLLAMSEDIRVLLVKLADRVHNMRTLHYIKKPEKRRRIALETMEIYAPLAERIGMAEFKTELEENSFAELHPDARDSIVNRLKFLEEQGGDLVQRIMGELNQTLAHSGIQASLAGREKSPYSIWRKMQRKDVAFEQLSDIMAFRVTVDSLENCYRALGVLHAAYPMVPGRFKDYISTPKPNGYRSLHTGVIGPERHRIEIQIRTAEMHEVAEMGVAAHWSYKQDAAAARALTEGRQYRWLRELLEILEHASNPEEFLEHTKLEMFQDQVFCFTPKGDLIALPRGATPVDFAYNVHSEVGDRCVGSKVNGRMVPLRSQLNNGDQVEIITNPKQTPSPEWERFVVTGKARARIRRFVRGQQRGQNVELGKKILQQAFRSEGYDMTEKGLAGVTNRFRAEDVEDIYWMVGEGQLSGHEVVMAVYPGLKMAQKVGSMVSLVKGLAGAKKKDTEGTHHSMPIRGLIPGMALHYARCCHPLPGDRIVGIVTTGKGVTIHTIDCDQLEQFSEQPERWLDLAWDTENDSQHHVGRINMVVANEPGSLGSLSTVIAKNMGNITNLKITNRSADFFDMIIDVDVRDVRHLVNIIAALRATPAVNSVERARR